MSNTALKPAYPTPMHARATENIVEFFASLPEVDAVILYGSCAHRRATPDSSLDILALVPPDILATQEMHLYRWIQEQVVGILGLPDLYERLSHLFEIQPFEGRVLAERGAALARLLDTYTGET